MAWRPGMLAVQGLETIEQLLEHVVVCDSGCWLWTGSDSGKKGRGAGYGKVMRRRQGGSMYVHRVVYETFVGPVRANQQVDHKCRAWWKGDGILVRRCCNPDHLEAVTALQNQRRKPKNVG